MKIMGFFLMHNSNWLRRDLVLWIWKVKRKSLSKMRWFKEEYFLLIFYLYLWFSVEFNGKRPVCLGFRRVMLLPDSSMAWWIVIFLKIIFLVSLAMVCERMESKEFLVQYSTTLLYFCWDPLYLIWKTFSLMFLTPFRYFFCEFVWWRWSDKGIVGLC